MNTCGDCIHWLQNVNPATGRVRPTYPGACGWSFIWPDAWPMAYGEGFSAPTRPKAESAWATDTATRCRCFSAKQEAPKKPQQLEISPTIPRIND